MAVTTAWYPRTWSEFRNRLGNTPLVPVEVTTRGRVHTLLLKLEGFNPFGSIKDRTAVGLLASVEQRAGRAPITVIESTSGNLGAALAGLCRLRGHSFIAIVDPRVQEVNLRTMEELGARIRMVTEADQSGSYLSARLRLLSETLATESDVHWTDQYSNPANPRAHFRMTGPEILAQAGPVDAVFVAVSTGGTASGIGQFLHAISPATRVIAVDVVGSAAIGGACGRRHLTGIGSTQASRFVAGEGDGSIDDRRWVESTVAVALCRKLAAETGLVVGGSSGAVVAGCLQDLERHPHPGRRLVCVCPDGGEKYRESIYEDGWVRRSGLSVDRTLAELDDRGIHFRCSTSM